MKEQKHLLSYVRRAVDDYEMIEDGDRIAVGVSGGKDSVITLMALSELRRFYTEKFEIKAITIDSDPGKSDVSEIRKMCESLGLDVIRLKRTQYGSIKLGMLAQGKYRDLTPEEVHKLMTSSGAVTKKKW